MKKIVFLFLIAALAFSFEGNAQKVTTLLGSSYGNALDTVSNTAVKYFPLKVTGSPSAIGIVLVITKISGTVGGTSSLEASNDGTNYAAIASSSNTNTDASQNWGWTISAPAYLYYRIKVAGTGTMSASVKATAVQR